MFLKVTPGVNFTKLCSTSKKTPAHRVWQKICRLISPTKFKPNMCAEICQICVPFAKRHLPNSKSTEFFQQKNTGKKFGLKLSCANMLVKLTP